MLTLATWWSPAGQCWRIEDQIMYTYYRLEDVIRHLKERDATALLVAPPHNLHTGLLDTALRAAGIPILYTPA